MAITLTRVFGPVALPSGEVPAHGRIRFTLRGWDIDGATLIPGATVEARLDAGGNLDTNLWASLSTAQQLAYGVEVTWWSPALRALARQVLPDIAVPAGADVLLKDLLSVPPPAGSTPASGSYDIPVVFRGTPGASEVLARFTMARNVAWAENFPLSAGSVEVAPAATFDIDVQVAEFAGATITSIGTVSIKSDGSYTFETAAGAPKQITRGQKLEFIAPATPDATIDGISFTLAGTELT